MSDMNVNACSSTSDAYIQSLLSSAANQTASSSGGIDPSSLTLPQDNSPQLSPFARILSTLQQLQQSDPSQYQQVTSQIATNLQDAAKTAGANGDTSQASELNQLAADFNNASQNNALPNIQDLAQAAYGMQRHHHHHDMQAAPSDPSGAGAADNGSSGSSSTPASGTGTASATYSDNLSQLISAFFVNSTSSAQNTALDPLSIINTTLSNAGLS